MSPLRMRMIEDMKLAGLSPGTQATYIAAVRKLAARRRRGSPAATLHNEPDPQNLLCRHVCLRSADRRGRNP